MSATINGYPVGMGPVMPMSGGRGVSLNFCPELHDLGRYALRTVLEHDLQIGREFDRVKVSHGLEDHGGHGLHTQFNVWKAGESGKGLTFRFIESVPEIPELSPAVKKMLADYFKGQGR